MKVWKRRHKELSSMHYILELKNFAIRTEDKGGNPG
jgi:hypothetical protein